MKTIKTVLIVAGIIVIVGTAGASDTNAITFGQAVKQVLLGAMCCSIAYLINVKESKQKWKNQNLLKAF